MSPESLAGCAAAAAAAASQAAKLLACTCGKILLDLDVHTDCNTPQLRDCLASAGAHKKAPQPSTTLRHQECRLSPLWGLHPLGADLDQLPRRSVVVFAVAVVNPQRRQALL